ncbi:hypothetical protein Dsin_005592 [Dipteronia sinensis]|uniref:Glycoside hydrolase family 38 N-terminal domain-containing protein n=1 Tax=Dipteronia sinensis TaxID=43782 RepID=A0AAE0EGM7_9ROSI|nr:hypothetical protein Dsin_005592 [Dipteronia sinensis]
MSYLKRRWRDASGSKRESFTNLVKNGQLEIVGGGWVMNDELMSLSLLGFVISHLIKSHANSHYFAIIEQRLLLKCQKLENLMELSRGQIARAGNIIGPGLCIQNLWRLKEDNILLVYIK